MGTHKEKAVEYLKGLDIQTTAMGRFNHTATYEAFKGLSDLYEEILAASLDENNAHSRTWKNIERTALI